MKYIGKGHRAKLGKSGHMIDMMSAILAAMQPEEPEAHRSYCGQDLDYLERDCEACALVSYGRDCHNNEIS